LICGRGDREATRLQPRPGRPRRIPGSGLNHAVLEVQPRRLDGSRHRQPLLDEAHHRLQDRRADPVRSGAADRQLDLAAAQDDGRAIIEGTRRPGAMR